MKKEILCVLIALMLVFPLVFADNVKSVLKEKTENLKESLDERTEDVMLEKIDMPDFLELPARILFGIEGEVTWQELIIVTGIWIGVFIIIFSVFDIMPFLNSGIQKYLGALIITALISLTGALDSMAGFFFDIAGFFKWTEKWHPLQVIIAIIIFGMVVFAVNWISKIINRKMMIEKAEIGGRKVREVIETSKVVDKINKIRLGEE